MRLLTNPFCVIASAPAVAGERGNLIKTHIYEIAEPVPSERDCFVPPGLAMTNEESHAPWVCRQAGSQLHGGPMVASLVPALPDRQGMPPWD